MWARNCAIITVILKFAFGPENFPGLSRNGPHGEKENRRAKRAESGLGKKKGGVCRLCFDAAHPWYQILVSWSDCDEYPRKKKHEKPDSRQMNSSNSIILIRKIWMCLTCSSFFSCTAICFSSDATILLCVWTPPIRSPRASRFSCNSACFKKRKEHLLLEQNWLFLALRRKETKQNEEQKEFKKNIPATKAQLTRRISQVPNLIRELNACEKRRLNRLN